MLKKVLLASVAVAGVTLGAGGAFAQRVPAVVGAPAFNQTTFLFTYGLDTGGQVAITLPFASYALLASPTFTGTVTTPNLAITGQQPAARVLASPTGTAGAPGWRTLVIGDVPGVAPLSNPVFTGTVTTPNLSVTGSQPANSVFAAPSGAAGAPSYRPLVAADVPFAAPVNNTALTGATTAQNLTVSGPLVAGGMFGRSFATIASPNTITVPAAGAAPSGATPIATAVVMVTTCSATQPVQLPSGPTAAGVSYQIILKYYPTGGVTTPCTFYPPSSGSVNGLAANAPATITANYTFTLDSTSAAAWYQ